MRLLILADTHLPKGHRAIPDEVWAEVDRADVVIHAGDWVGEQVLDGFERRARRLVGVWGNNDGDAVRARVPETARVELGGVRFAVTHEAGASARREARMRAAFPDVDVLVFGHSHIPWDTQHAGLRLLNPGSPTDRRRQPHGTYLTAEVADGVLNDVMLHRVIVG